MGETLSPAQVSWSLQWLGHALIALSSNRCRQSAKQKSTASAVRAAKPSLVASVVGASLAAAGEVEEGAGMMDEQQVARWRATDEKQEVRWRTTDVRDRQRRMSEMEGDGWAGSTTTDERDGGRWMGGMDNDGLARWRAKHGRGGGRWIGEVEDDAWARWRTLHGRGGGQWTGEVEDDG